MEYLNAAGRIPLLTADEEILLGRAIQAAQQLLMDKPDGPYDRKERGILHRGRKAKDRMVTANMRLVVDVSRKYRRQCMHLNHEDLLQEGTFGLIRAAEKFDPERGYKFSTYAYWWIRQSMARAITVYDRSIRLPGHVGERIMKLRAWICMNAERHKCPTLAECAEFLDVDESLARDCLYHMQSIMSLDARARHNDADTSALIDLIPDANNATPWQYVENDLSNELKLVQRILPQLPEKQQEVIQLRFFEGFFSYEKVGQRLGLSRESVRTAERKAIRQIRARIELTA